jgi:hypothetical protein
MGYSVWGPHLVWALYTDTDKAKQIDRKKGKEREQGKTVH